MKIALTNSIVSTRRGEISVPDDIAKRYCDGYVGVMYEYVREHWDEIRFGEFEPDFENTDFDIMEVIYED